MAKPKIHKKQSPAVNAGQQTPGDFTRILNGLFYAIASMVDRFGWAGAALVLTFAFVEFHATTAQKQEIIDKFILGKDSADWAKPYWLLVVLAILLFIAQHYYFKRIIMALNQSNTYLSKTLSDLQQQQIGPQTPAPSAPPGPKQKQQAPQPGSQPGAQSSGP